MKTVVRITKQGKVKDVHPASLVASPALDEVDAKVACIQALIPIALAAVEEELRRNWPAWLVPSIVARVASPEWSAGLASGGRSTWPTRRFL